MKLNLGCGLKRMDGWINCDIDVKTRPDMILDLTKRLPFKDGEVCVINMDNVLEHVGLGCLNELNRVLMRGGKIFLIVPNFFRWKARIHFALFGRLEDSDGWETNHQLVISYQDLRAILRNKGFEVPYKSFWETLFMPEISIIIRKRNDCYNATKK